MYRLGLYEKAMPAGMAFPDMLASARDAGFDFLEISIDETDARLSRLDWSDSERSALRRDIADSGIQISSMCLSGHRKYPLGSRDAATRARGIEIFRKAVDFSEDIGVRLIQLAGYDVYYEEGGSDTEKWFAENLALCTEYAAMHSVTAGFETMETPFMDNISKAMNYVRRIDSPYLGVYPDLGNLTNACLLYGTTVEEEIECGRGHLFAMHIKETVPGKYRDMDFGIGGVDFPAGIRKAYEVGVRQYVTEFWHNGCENWQERLRSVSAFASDAFKKAGIDKA